MAAGDSGCEAYTAIAWGAGLSHERSDIAGAEGFYSPEGNMCGTAMRGAVALPGSNGRRYYGCKRAQPRIDVYNPVAKNCGRCEVAAGCQSNLHQRCSAETSFGVPLSCADDVIRLRMIIAALHESGSGRYCCKSLKLPRANFPVVKKSDRRPPIDVASIALPRSPASLSSAMRSPTSLHESRAYGPENF